MAVAFWYVAVVNGKADALTRKLGNVKPDIESVNVKDINRLCMHASSMSDPISFQLLFKRLSWQNVTASAIGLVVSLLIGIIKSII